VPSFDYSTIGPRRIRQTASPFWDGPRQEQYDLRNHLPVWFGAVNSLVAGDSRHPLVPLVGRRGWGAVLPWADGCHVI
jgi:hypothetical protein